MKFPVYTIRVITVAIVAVFLFTVPVIHAELITEQSLSFGKIAVISNDSQSTVQLTRSGKVSTTNHIHVLQLGQPGVYTLTELPPYTLINLTADVPAYSASTIPGTQQFHISVVDMPSAVQADASGQAQFKLGGVLSTSGTGGTYVSPASYQIMLPINISY